MTEFNPLKSNFCFGLWWLENLQNNSWPLYLVLNNSTWKDDYARKFAGLYIYLGRDLRL